MSYYTEEEYRTYKRVKAILDEKENDAFYEYLKTHTEIKDLDKYEFEMEYWQSTWGGSKGAVWTYTITNKETDEYIMGQTSQPYAKHQERHEDDFITFYDEEENEIDIESDKVPRDFYSLYMQFALSGEELYELYHKKS